MQPKLLTAYLEPRSHALHGLKDMYEMSKHCSAWIGVQLIIYQIIPWGGKGNK